MRVISPDEELTRAIAVIRPLLCRALDEGEQDDLDVLSDLVEKYEAEEHPMPRVSDADMLRHLIDARDVTRARLASDVGIPDSTISEVLAGKRRLTRKHIGTLANDFGVSPNVFSF
jgi:HTH-type transcriptional regulator/antitoxin HigA